MVGEIYLRKDTAYLPTLGKTEAGFYSGIEPVAVVPIRDADAFVAAIKETITRGNPAIPTPKRDAWPEPVILKYAKVKSWSAFEKEALYWGIEEKGGTYQIEPGKRHPEGGWEDDRERIETLPNGTTVDDFAKRVVALVQSKAVSE